MRRSAFLRRMQRVSGAECREDDVEHLNRLAGKPESGSRSPANARLAAIASRDRPIEDLEGVRIPRLLFVDMGERLLDLGELALPGVVIYVFPGCETEDGESLEEDLAQHRDFEDLRARFASVIPGGAVVGVSMVPPLVQYRCAYERGVGPVGDEWHIPHHLVLDDRFALARTLGLPVCEYGESAYYDRVTLVARDGKIRKVFACSRAGDDARQALAWLQLS